MKVEPVSKTEPKKEEPAKQDKKKPEPSKPEEKPDEDNSVTLDDEDQALKDGEVQVTDGDGNTVK